MTASRSPRTPTSIRIRPRRPPRVPAAVGTATGAATGAIRGGAGTGALIGLVSGSIIGFFSWMFGASEPDPVFVNYVDRCLAERGYESIGWK